MNKRKIIQRLIPAEIISNSNAYFKQDAILKSLIKDYPDECFWKNVNFDFNLTSLFFFKTKKGKGILSLKYKDFISNHPTQGLMQFSWGENKDKSSKAKTTKKFLNE